MNRSFDIGGPDILTYAEMMQRYAAVAGLPRRRILPVPVLHPVLSSHWVGLVTPVPAGIARPLVESLRNTRSSATSTTSPRTCRTRRAGLIGFDGAVRLALQRVQGGRGRDPLVLGVGAGRARDPLPTDPDWAGGSLYADVRDPAGRRVARGAVAR